MASYTAWVELLLLVVLFVGAMGIIGTNLNAEYDKNADLTFGLQTNSTQNALQGMQKDIVNSTNEGQSSMTDFGIFKLATLPKIIFTISAVLWDFVSGSFIKSIVGLMQIGAYSNIVITVFTLLYWIAIAFILLKLVTRMIP
jgi:hypothetical protein